MTVNREQLDADVKRTLELLHAEFKGDPMRVAYVLGDLASFVERLRSSEAPLAEIRPAPVIGGRVADEETKQHMRELATIIEKRAPKGFKFSLMFFEPGDGDTIYMTSAEPEMSKNKLRELLARMDGGFVEDGGHA